MSGKIVYLIFVVLVCIMINIVALWLVRKFMIKRKEDFSEITAIAPSEVKDETAGPIISKRIELFKGGLSGFFADQKLVRKMPEFQSWINDHVYIWPSSQDVCCATLEESPCNCEEFYITNSSCLDTRPYFFNKNFRKNIQSTLGGAKNGNCSMSILSNNYELVRRNTDLKVKDIQDVTTVDGNYYRLVLSPKNALHVAFLRPFYISFNTVGLFEVVHEDVDEPTRVDDFEQKKLANMFAYFEHPNSNSYIMYLRPVKNKKLYPSESKSLTGYFHSKLSKSDISCNMYYFNYKSQINTKDKVSKVFSFYINKAVYNSTFKDNNSVSVSTNDSNSQVANVVSITKAPDGNIVVEVDDHKYAFPIDFPFYDMEQFDLFICYAFNALIMVGFGRHNNKIRSVMIRHHLSKQFKISFDELKETYKSQSSESFKEISELFSIDSVPNFGALFDQLGYVS